MLIQTDRLGRRYKIALTNASDAAELMSDLSYLEAVPSGVLTFDFTHMVAPLTQEMRDQYLPGHFGYQPARQLLEVVSAIAFCADMQTAYPHHLVARLPDRSSRVGDFLHSMRLTQVLAQLGLLIVNADPVNAEFGSDDCTRQNLIPLTRIDVPEHGHPDFRLLQEVRQRVEGAFCRALPDALDLAGCFTSIVNEAIDNLIEYGRGGIIGGLYYPRAGEVEIGLVNRCGGFGGADPSEELEFLVRACEGVTNRGAGGGNGIAELSALAMRCFGTLVLRNGSATLNLLPDGSAIAMTTDTGLSTPGASVTILLQLLPVRFGEPTQPLQAFEAVLRTSLAPYLH